MEFSYDGGGMGKGATTTLYVDGQKVGEGRIGRTHALFFSMDETTEVGCDVGPYRKIMARETINSAAK